MKNERTSSPLRSWGRRSGAMILGDVPGGSQGHEGVRDERLQRLIVLRRGANQGVSNGSVVPKLARCDEGVHTEPVRAGRADRQATIQLLLAPKCRNQQIVQAAPYEATR